MFQLMKPDTKIDFVGKKMFFIGLSLIAVIVSIVALFVRGGLNLGVDFTGGIVIRARVYDHSRGEEHPWTGLVQLGGPTCLRSAGVRSQYDLSTDRC